MKVLALLGPLMWDAAWFLGPNFAPVSGFLGICRLDGRYRKTAALRAHTRGPLDWKLYFMGFK